MIVLCSEINPVNFSNSSFLMQNQFVHKHFRLINLLCVLEVWNQFVDNCFTSNKPGALMTVDEQLFPTKARCFFTQFIASKLDKFRQKCWLAVDKESKYVMNGFPYVGKNKTRSSN